MAGDLNGQCSAAQRFAANLLSHQNTRACLQHPTMFGGGDGNLSDSSDAPSHISNRSEALNGREHLLNPNLNLSISLNSSVVEDRKTQEIRSLKEENCRLKRRLQDILRDSEDDDEDVRKDWSELSKKRKKQLLSNISAQMGKLAGERGARVVNIAASLIAR